MNFQLSPLLLLLSFVCVSISLSTNQGFKSDHHRSDSAPAVELKPLPKGMKSILNTHTRIHDQMINSMKNEKLRFNCQNRTMRIERRRLPRVKLRDQCQNQAPIQNQIYRIQRWVLTSNRPSACMPLLLILSTLHSHSQNFEHTVHVGFDAITGEFTVSSSLICRFIYLFVCRSDYLLTAYVLI